MDKIIVITGGFDPLHSGHLSLIEESQKAGRVIIGLNSDEWLTRKKGAPFQLFEERYHILSNLKNVLCVIGFDDSDDSAIDAIKKSQEMFLKSQIVFANGGDRTTNNILELKYCQQNNIELLFGVGGNTKKNSSSWLLANWKHPSEDRHWGKFETYYDSKQAKVKRLILEPGKSISMQYHNKRSEFWFIESGVGKIYTLDQNNQEHPLTILNKHQSYHVPIGQWHRLENIGIEHLCIIEIQYGTECNEEDIIRIE